VEFESAAEIFERARSLFHEAGNECEALFAETWVAYCKLRIPDVSETRLTFENLAQKFQERNYRSLFALALNALSDAEMSANEFSKALAYAEQSLKLCEELRDTASVIRNLGQLQSLQLSTGSYHESLNSSFIAIGAADELPYDPTILWHLYHEAALDFHQSHLITAAFDYEHEAQRLADIANNPLLKARSLDRLAAFEERSKNYESALSLLNKALDQAAQIRGDASRAVTQVHTMLTLGHVHGESGNFPAAIDYFDRTLTLSKDLNGLEIYVYQAHKGKFLALWQLNQDTAAAVELDTAVNLFENYRNKINEESYRDQFFDTDQNTYDLAVDFKYSQQHDFDKAFEYSEAYRARSLYNLMSTTSHVLDRADRPEINSLFQTRALDRQAVQNSLSEEIQLIEYSVLDNKVVIWVISKDEFEHAESAITPTELSEKVERYVEALLKNRGNDDDRVAALSRELYDSLIAPVESKGYLKTNVTVCIVPDKSLAFLPFAALLSPAGRYLIQDYTIQIAPSATVFAKSSEAAKRLSGNRMERLLSVGNPSFDRLVFDSSPELPEAAREAEQVASFYPPAKALLAQNATIDEVTNALPTVDVAHFATHAIANKRSPFLSQLLLAKTNGASAGFLQASDLYRLKLPRTRLVVLSACQTGIEQAYRGEGAIGLSRPFTAAGVPLVVASLWPVDSNATAELMINFHKHRKLDPLSTVKALRTAQMELLNSPDKRLRNPQVWAAFVTIGGYAEF
jgi:CHAT domain-containing protein